MFRIRYERVVGFYHLHPGDCESKTRAVHKQKAVEKDAAPMRYRNKYHCSCDF